MQRADITDRMPTGRELEDAGSSDLTAAIHQHGGYYTVAARLGLPLALKPPGYWDEFANLECELRAYLAEQGLGEQMPGVAHLKRVN